MTKEGGHSSCAPTSANAGRLQIYVREYAAIVKHLVKKGAPRDGRDYVLVNKDELYRLFDRNAYEPAESKLKTWKGLHWITADPGRLTKRVSQQGRTVPMVKIDLSVYQTLVKITGDTTQ